MRHALGRLHHARGLQVDALATRGNAADADVGCSDFAYLAQVDIASWPASERQLCRDDVPVNTRYAHGADFVAAG